MSPIEEALVVPEETTIESTHSGAPVGLETDQLQRAVDEANTLIEFKTRAMRLLLIPRPDSHEG